MGFNRRKMEDRRRKAAKQEAAARRATEKQILADAYHLVAVWNERQAKRMPMLFSPTIRRGHHGRLLVPVGALSSLPHHRRRRSPVARLAPRRGRHGSYPRAIVPLLPPACAVRRTRLLVEMQRRGGFLCGV